MTLLICPVRPGDSNEELRYAIRSWETNLHLPGGPELLVVGYKPVWLEPDHFIPGNRYKSMPITVYDNVLLGATWAADHGYEEVVYMNDDFFCLDPMGCILPVRRNISLREHIQSFPQNAGLWWPRSLRLTLSWLEEQGYEDPHSYEVHRPLVADPLGMATALQKFNHTEADMVPQWRTVYGVLNDVRAYPVQDAKLSLRVTGVGTPWLSTSDESWRRFGKSITKRFQKPSGWER